MQDQLIGAKKPYMEYKMQIENKMRSFNFLIMNRPFQKT